ncbi:MAG: hypothetical protein ACLR23_25520 [Clostridia bacterium]
MRTEGLSPFYADLDGHFTSKPLEGNFHGAIITTPSLGIKTWYEVDSVYKHWMIWNCEREGSFICIEPQNWKSTRPIFPFPRTNPVWPPYYQERILWRERKYGPNVCDFSRQKITFILQFVTQISAFFYCARRRNPFIMRDSFAFYYAAPCCCHWQL